MLNTPIPDIYVVPALAGIARTASTDAATAAVSVVARSRFQSPASVLSQCLLMFVLPLFMKVNPCIKGAIQPEAREYMVLHIPCREWPDWFVNKSDMCHPSGLAVLALEMVTRECCSDSIGNAVRNRRSVITRVAFRPLCSAITRSRRRGRRQMFVMRANRQRPGAHPESLADPMEGKWCRGGHDESGQVGE